VKRLERTITIRYRWWREKGTILPEHVNALEEAALERIQEMMGKGFVSGELNDSISMKRRKDVEYSGHWEVENP